MVGREGWQVHGLETSQIARPSHAHDVPSTWRSAWCTCEDTMVEGKQTACGRDGAARTVRTPTARGVWSRWQSGTALAVARESLTPALKPHLGPVTRVVH